MFLVIEAVCDIVISGCDGCGDFIFVSYILDNEHGKQPSFMLIVKKVF